MKLEHATLVARAADVVPNDFQKYTVIAACILIPVVAVIWHAPGLRDVFVGPKVSVIFMHEAFHVLAGVMCGGRLRTFVIDPNEGGHTAFDELRAGMYDEFGNWTGFYYTSSKHGFMLLAGTIGSSIVGFAYVFAAFDIVASKAASFTIGIQLLIAGWYAIHWMTYLSVFAAEAILIGMWFGAHGSALRFYVLFFGVMHLFYGVWDYFDEILFAKPSPSDSTMLMESMGMPRSAWFGFLFVFECAVFVSAIFFGVIVLKKSTEDMYEDAAGFLPTR